MSVEQARWRRSGRGRGCSQSRAELLLHQRSGSRARPWRCAMPPAGLKPTLIAGALVVLADRAHHHERDRERGVDAFLAGRGLDEVGAGHHADQRGAARRCAACRARRWRGSPSCAPRRRPRGRRAPRRRAPASRRSAHAARVMTMSISLRAGGDRRLDLARACVSSGVRPAGKPVETAATGMPRALAAPRPRSATQRVVDADGADRDAQVGHAERLEQVARARGWRALAQRRSHAARRVVARERGQVDAA